MLPRGTGSRHTRLLTVRGSGYRLDVEVPALVPIAELMPSLVRACTEAGGPDAGDGPEPPAWTLARVGAPALDPSTTLSEARVLDGEVLHVVDAASWPAPAVTGADAEAPVGSTGEKGRSPLTETRVAVLACTAVVSVAAATAIGAATQAVQGAAGLLTLLAGGTVLALAIKLRPGSDRGLASLPRLAMVVGGWLLAGLGFWGLAGASRGPEGVAAAGLAVGAAALAALRIAPAPSLAVIVVAGWLVAGAAAVAGGAPTDVAGVVVGVLCMGLLRVWPPLCALLLAARTADTRLDQEAVAAAAGRWQAALAAVSAGLVAVVLGAVVAALAGGGVLSLAFALVAGLSLALRARARRSLAHALPQAVGAAAALVAVEVAAALQLRDAGADLAGGVVALAGTGMVLAGASAVWNALLAPPSPPPSAWLLIDDVLPAPLALAKLGVFAAVAQAVQHLLR